MPSRKGAADFYSSTCNSNIANLRIKRGQRPDWFKISQPTNPFEQVSYFDISDKVPQRVTPLSNILATTERPTLNLFRRIAGKS